MNAEDYGIADTTRNYFYTVDGTSGTEYEAANKAELVRAISTGKVTSFRVEVNQFYFKEKKAAK